MRLSPALLIAALLMTSASALAGEPNCTGLAGGPRVCEGEAGYGDPDECEENAGSFNTYMRLSAIWIEVDDSTSVHESTYESCLRADRIGVDREYYSASLWLEQDGEETTIFDYTYRRDGAVEACTVEIADQVIDVDPDACLIREDVHAHDVLP